MLVKGATAFRSNRIYLDALKLYVKYHLLAFSMKMADSKQNFTEDNAVSTGSFY